jgi:ribosomal-protein-alanine N-acetyltransferase
MSSKNPIDGIQIKRIGSEDLDALMEIECSSFTAPWSRQSYEEALAMDSVEGFVAKIGDEIVGYMLMQFVASEVEFHTFAVKPLWRRMGLGRALLDFMLKRAAIKEAVDIFLLVRPSNVPARRLYDKMGFKPVGIRKRYYRDDMEDALLMRLNLKAT